MCQSERIWLFCILLFHLPFTIYHLPFTIYHLPFTIYHSPFTIHHSLIMLKFFRYILAIWGFLCFFMPFLLMLPFFHLFATKEKWHKYASSLNYWWANIFFAGMCIPYKVEYRFRPKKNEVYVFCPNHTSLVDIIAMGLVRMGDFAFIGKEELTKVPLFGSMFKKIHIPVNRESKIGSYRALVASREALEKQRSVVIFPEGGIYGQNFPVLNTFKDGAFRLAIEKQVPIVPVTMLYNWIILRDEQWLPQWHRGKIIVHEPISTIGLTAKDIEFLKQKTFAVIENELSFINPKK